MWYIVHKTGDSFMGPYHDFKEALTAYLELNPDAYVLEFIQ